MWPKVRSIHPLIVILFLLCSACESDSFVPFAQVIRGDFDPENVPNIERVIYTFAQERNLGIRPVDKWGVQRITQGLPAFFLFIYIPGYEDPVISVGNGGVANKLSMHLHGGDPEVLTISSKLFIELQNVVEQSNLATNMRSVEPPNET